MSEDNKQAAATGNTDAAAAPSEQNNTSEQKLYADANVATDATKKADAAKPDQQPAKTDEVKADSIELTLPEGLEVDKSAVDRIASFAKEHGLSKTAAQALLDREIAMTGDRQKTALAELDAQSKAWKEEIMNDRDFGGEKAAETAQLAHEVAKRFGSDHFVQELERTGLGNHPDLVRMLARIGKAMSDDKLKGGGTPPGANKKSAEEVFYGSQS